MVAPIKFNTQTDLAEGLIELVKRLDKSLQLKEESERTDKEIPQSFGAALDEATQMDQTVQH